MENANEPNSSQCAIRANASGGFRHSRFHSRFSIGVVDVRRSYGAGPRKTTGSCAVCGHRALFAGRLAVGALFVALWAAEEGSEFVRIASYKIGQVGSLLPSGDLVRFHVDGEAVPGLLEDRCRAPESNAKRCMTCRGRTSNSAAH